MDSSEIRELFRPAPGVHARPAVRGYRAGSIIGPGDVARYRPPAASAPKRTEDCCDGCGAEWSGEKYLVPLPDDPAWKRTGSRRGVDFQVVCAFCDERSLSRRRELGALPGPAMDEQLGRCA